MTVMSTPAVPCVCISLFIVHPCAAGPGECLPPPKRLASGFQHHLLRAQAAFSDLLHFDQVVSLPPPGNTFSNILLSKQCHICHLSLFSSDNTWQKHPARNGMNKHKCFYDTYLCDGRLLKVCEGKITPVRFCSRLLTSCLTLNFSFLM